MVELWWIAFLIMFRIMLSVLVDGSQKRAQPLVEHPSSDPPFEATADDGSDTSGATLHQDCLTYYNDLKLKQKYKYIIYKLNPTMTEILVDKASEEKDYEKFLDDFPRNEPRWAVYDFEYTDQGYQRDQLVFYVWSARITPAVYRSTRDVLRSSLREISGEIHGSNREAIAFENVLESAIEFGGIGRPYFG